MKNYYDTYRKAATKSCVISSSCAELVPEDSSVKACIRATHCRNSVSFMSPLPVK
jgi:hypothetical protein